MKQRFSKVSTDWLEQRVNEKRKYKDSAIVAITKYKQKRDKYHREINEMIDEINRRRS